MKKEEITFAFQVLFAVLGYGNMIRMMRNNKGQSQEHDPFVWLFGAVLHAIAGCNIYQLDGEYFLSGIMSLGALVMAFFSTMSFNRNNIEAVSFKMYATLSGVVAISLLLCIVCPQSLLATIAVNSGLVAVSLIQIILFSQYEDKNPVVSWIFFACMSSVCLLINQDFTLAKVLQPVISTTGSIVAIFGPLFIQNILPKRPFQKVFLGQISIKKDETQSAVSRFLAEFVEFWIEGDIEEYEQEHIGNIRKTFIEKTVASFAISSASIKVYSLHAQEVVFEDEAKPKSFKDFVANIFKRKKHTAFTFWQFFTCIYLYKDSFIHKIEKMSQDRHVVIPLRFKNNIEYFELYVKEKLIVLQPFSHEDKVRAYEVVFMVYKK